MSDKYIKICKNGHEEFYWPTEDPLSLCPEEGFYSHDDRLSHMNRTEHPVYISASKLHKEIVALRKDAVGELTHTNYREQMGKVWALDEILEWISE